MNGQASLSLGAYGRTLVMAERQPPVRSLAHGWGKTLAAALAVHLAAFVGLFALTGTAPPPPPRPEPVVVVQLAPPATTDAATSPALPAAAAPAAPAQPAPARPAPKIEKTTAAQPQPAKLVTKAPSHKTPPPATPVPVALASVTPAPVVAAALTPSTAGQTTTPAVTRPGASTSASAAVAVTIQPKPISQPRPTYPASAQRRGLEGKVILQVTVGADGAVRAVAVSRGSSHSSLDDAAVAGVWNWRFLPGKVGGEAKEMTIFLPVDFRLR